MIDVRLPNTKTLENPLGKSRKRTLHQRPEPTTLANGANHMLDWQNKAFKDLPQSLLH